MESEVTNELFDIVCPLKMRPRHVLEMFMYQSKEDNQNNKRIYKIT